MMTSIPHVTYADPQENLLSVSFMKVGKLYYFDFQDFPDIKIGDYVIAETAYLGQQMGQVKGFKPRQGIERDQIFNLLRPATPADLLIRQQWQEREVPVLIECREKAAQMGGFDGVKFVAAEYNFDGSLVTFLVTTEDTNKTINTGRLRNIMQKHLNTRVEFRQIGPRDVAKVQEGFGACGIPRCCSTFLTEFSMVSINMAKAQGISLNPSEITGMCGRLRCCLIYEYEQYVEARKQLPKLRKRVGTPHGEGRVIEVHPLKDAVTVQVDDTRHFVQREELIPLAEYEALKEAAASPCSKSASGGCDCGAKRPRGSADELLEEMGVPAYASAEEDIEDNSGEIEGASLTSEEADGGESAEQAPKRRRNNRRRRPNKKKSEGGE